MGSFFKRHQYLIVWILGLIIIGSLAVLIVQMNDYIPPSNPTFPSRPSAEPPAPATPSVTLGIEQQGKNKKLLVSWANLPASTTALGIFRKLTGTTSTGQLIAIIQVAGDQLANGGFLLDLGHSDETGYSFYAEAVGDEEGGGNGGGTSTSPSSTVFWTSDILIPEPPNSPSSTDEGSGNGNGGNEAASSSATSTPGNSNATSSQNPGSGSGGNETGSGNGTSSVSSGNGAGPSSQSGDSYYTPQIQGIGGSADYGTFWVQHANQNIEINWQNLPGDVTSIVIARSESSTGPWNQILQEENPSVNGSSSIQLVDGTVGDPYYYEMTAFTGTTTIAIFGPEYLAPVGE
jgi:hypothetical protein